jgi:DNA (cytosine-5)-methyltransferase 1
MKYKKEDHRNELLLVMIELIEELRPKVVMMENVPGLVTRGKSIFREFLKTLSRLGYKYKWRIEQMADYGVPQYRRRLVLLAGNGFEVNFPEPQHAKSPLAGSRMKPWKSVRAAIGHLPAPITFASAMASGGPEKANWHVARKLQPQTKRRLKQAEPGGTWLTLDESLRPTCHQNGYNGFTNVYGRMAWEQVSPTITGGCTTPCKGRFGHPDKRRYGISVREAALLQSFPERYQFKTDQMDAVCDLIGNAVPPRYAKLAATQILLALEQNRKPERAK